MYKILGGDGKEYGPVSADTLRQWIAEGRANAQTQIQREGATGWTALAAFPEFAAAFAAPPGTIGAAMPPAQSMNPLAIVGFCLSVFSITIGLCCCYGLPFNLAGVICSFIGMHQVKAQPERYTGRGLAIAGIIIGAVSLLLGIALFALGMALSWSDIAKELK